jgi:hypothetical protein
MVNACVVLSGGLLALDGAIGRNTVLSSQLNITQYQKRDHVGGRGGDHPLIEVDFRVRFQIHRLLARDRDRQF